MTKIDKIEVHILKTVILKLVFLVYFLSLFWSCFYFSTTACHYMLCSFTVKAGLLVKNLRDYIQPPALLEVLKPTPHLSLRWEAQLLGCWLQEMECEGADSICLSDWSCSTMRKTFKIQDQRWTKRGYHCIIQQFVVTWQKEICVPFLLQHVATSFYVHKALNKIVIIKISDPMFFLSPFCLIGLSVSAPCRRIPYQKYEAFLTEWKD